MKKEKCYICNAPGFEYLPFGELKQASGKALSIDFDAVEKDLLLKADGYSICKSHYWNYLERKSEHEKINPEPYKSLDKFIESERERHLSLYRPLSRLNRKIRYYLEGLF